MKCRGKNTREKIVREYERVPKLHTVLLNGQTKVSDADAIIKNEYYIFELTRKCDGKKEFIQCGMGAARDFLKLTRNSGLPIFNPLNLDIKLSNKNDVEEKDGQRIKEKWNPIARQLYNAIMWIIILWDIKPDTPVFFIKDRVSNKMIDKPLCRDIKSINTIISKLGKGKTLTQYIENLKSENNIKESLSDFSLLIAELELIEDSSGRKIESYF